MGMNVDKRYIFPRLLISVFPHFSALGNCHLSKFLMLSFFHLMYLSF